MHMDGQESSNTLSGRIRSNAGDRGQGEKDADTGLHVSRVRDERRADLSLTLRAENIQLHATRLLYAQLYGILGGHHGVTSSS